jgi:hypothetical protein
MSRNPVYNLNLKLEIPQINQQQAPGPCDISCLNQTQKANEEVQNLVNQVITLFLKKLKAIVFNN